jgi:putative methyltransferase
LLQLTDVKNVKTLQYDFLNININHYDNIKYILVDPTCTSSGIFVEACKSSQKTRIQHFQYLLSMILRYTLQTFPNVKRVVYTTCSLYPEEGEIVIDDVLDEIGDSYSLLDVKEMLWNEWESVSSIEYACGEKCVRIIPEFDLCQGYFIAVFERNFDVEVPPYIKRFKKKTKTNNDDNNESDIGNLIQTCAFNHKQDMMIQEPKVTLENRSNKNVIKKKKFTSNKKKKLLAYQQTRFITQSPDLVINNEIVCTNYSVPHEIYETTHNQLYP